MTIHEVGSVNQIPKYNSTNKNVKASYTSETDSISVSSEARALGELYQTAEAVRLSDDIRMDKVEAAKKRLESADFANETTINAVADKLMDLFRI